MLEILEIGDGIGGLDRDGTQTDNLNPNIKKKPKYRTTTILFVEQTRRGELARRLREMEPRLMELTGFRIKTVERSGSKLGQIFANTNPWAGAKCVRDDCVPCKQGGERLDNCY